MLPDKNREKASCIVIDTNILINYTNSDFGYILSSKFIFNLYVYTVITLLVEPKNSEHSNTEHLKAN